MSVQATELSPGTPLNLGCGDDIRNGWHNVDIVPNEGVDEVYNLENTPWPWPDDISNRILMDNVLEHLNPRSRPHVLDECHRVLASSGLLEVVLPVPNVGIGWDVSHYSIPSWSWYRHPSQRDRWQLKNLEISKIGLGNLVPDDRLALTLTEHAGLRCVDQVTVKVEPL